MSKNLSVFIISIFLIGIIIPLLYFVTKSSFKKIGKCLYGFPKKVTAGTVGTIVLAFVLLVILIFRNYGNMTIVLAGCCVLAVFIMTKEFFLGRSYGIYEKGMVVPNNVILYEDIISFPIFQLPIEEQEHYPKNVLIVVTKKKGKIEIVFSSEDQCNEIIEQLKNLEVLKY